MRPLKLKMSAFGPYAAEQSLDMQSLGSSGLYLITGKTGAGKTTIFDAISYALFGEASGDTRKDSMLRSKYALPETETYVELEFEYNGEKYKIKRNPEYLHPSKRGDKEVRQAAGVELVMPDGKAITKKGEVSAAVEELLGVNKKQFSQIAMIAQGDFKKILDSSTKDRIEIFRHLFNTDNYKKLQDRLFVEAKQVKGRQLEFKNSVEQYLNSVRCAEDNVLSFSLLDAQAGEMLTEEAIALIEEIISDDEERFKKILSQQGEVDGELAKITSSLELARQPNENRRLFNEGKQKIAKAEEELKQAEALLSAERSREPQRSALANEISVLASRLPQFEELTLLLNETASAASKIAAMQKSLAEQENALKSAEQKTTAIESRLEALRDCGSKLERCRAEIDRLSSFGEAVDECLSRLGIYNDKITDYENEMELFRSQAELAGKLTNEYAAMNELFLREQAGIIAQELAVGEPCPVCGSVEHPHPAAKAENAPTEAEVKAAKEKSEAANSKANTILSQAKELSAGAAAVKQELAERAEKLVEGFSLDNAEEMLNCLKEQNAINLAEQESRLNRETENVRIKSVLEAELPRLKESRQAAQEKISQLKNEITALTTEREHKQRQSEKMKSELGFESKALADSRLRVLRLSLSQMQSSLERAEAEYKKISEGISALKGEQDGLKKALEGLVEIDEQALVERKNALLANKKSLEQARDEVNSRIVNNKENLREINKKSAELIEVEKRLSWIKALSDTANGTLNGRERVQLETYVQMTYFDRIIKRANIRLLKMTGEQYELVRRREADSKNKQTGLDLDVIDHCNGSVRDVGSLSGGESFKASLALALGLSDEIQSSAGGVRLDTMFVDEGFGSLDSDSVEQAVGALMGLGDSNRLVGIISHVSTLNDRIDKKIVVSKDGRNGSEAHIVI